MTEKATMRFIKEKVKELGLHDKMEFFHWLMQNVLQDLSEKVEGESKHDTTT